MNKFMRILLFNLKVETNFKFDYFVRLFMYFFHVIIFNELWDYMLKDKILLGYDKRSIIWYIIIGEAVIYTMSKNFLRISNDIKSGDIVNILTKPINILEYIFLREFTSIINLIFNILFAIVCGIALIGNPHIDLVNIILFIFSIFISYFLILFLQIFIGILAFFFEDNDSFYLIISKAILIVTITPFDFYHGLIRDLIAILPTTYVTYSPAKIFLGCDLETAFRLLIIQVICFIFVFTIVYLISKKGVKKIYVNGG